MPSDVASSPPLPRISLSHILAIAALSAAPHPPPPVRFAPAASVVPPGPASPHRPAPETPQTHSKIDRALPTACWQNPAPAFRQSGSPALSRMNSLTHNRLLTG